MPRALVNIGIIHSILVLIELLYSKFAIEVAYVVPTLCCYTLIHGIAFKESSYNLLHETSNAHKWVNLPHEHIKNIDSVIKFTFPYHFRLLSCFIRHGLRLGDMYILNNLELQLK